MLTHNSVSHEFWFHSALSLSLTLSCTGPLCRLRVFDSGVMVVQLQSHSEEEMIASALDSVSFTLIWNPCASQDLQMNDISVCQPWWCLCRCQTKAHWQQRSLRSSWVSLCFCLKSGELTRRLLLSQLPHTDNQRLFFFPRLQAAAGWEDGSSVQRRLCGGFEILPKPLLTDLRLRRRKSL